MSPEEWQRVITAWQECLQQAKVVHPLKLALERGYRMTVLLSVDKDGRVAEKDGRPFLKISLE